MTLKRFFLPATLVLTAFTGVASADLLGIQPGFPLLAYDNLGETSYDASTFEYDVDAAPLSIRFTAQTPPRPVVPTGPNDERFLQLRILVDNDGNLIGGLAGPDLLIVGEVDADGDGTIDYEGTLLTGEILAFGFQDGPGGGESAGEATFDGSVFLSDLLSGRTEQSRYDGGATHLGAPFPGGTDEFDFRFRLTGGSLAPLYASGDIALLNTSEPSTFETFNEDFEGDAKGLVGTAPPIGACCLPDGTCDDGRTQQDCEDAGGYFGGRESLCASTECPGACCLPDESCEELTRTECANRDGQFQGQFVSCDGVDCTFLRGACCLDEGSCVIRTNDECGAQGGEYQGDDSGCEPGLCDLKGACCIQGDCVVQTQEECDAEGGDYRGDGVDCEPGLCDLPTGACCFEDGSCFVLTSIDCMMQGGAYQGDDVPCDPGRCPDPKGACCLVDGTCVVQTEAECMAEGGDYNGDGTNCEPGLCDLPNGACCFDDGSCVVLTQNECRDEGGSFQGAGTTCIPGLCPQPLGACCFPNGACFQLTRDDCAAQGGEYLDDGMPCDPNQCPPPKGACCLDDGTCVAQIEEDCIAQGGVYRGDETICEPNICDLPTGACCFPDGSCIELTQAACIDGGGTYQGSGSECVPGLCPQPRGACCFPSGLCIQLTAENCDALGGDYMGDAVDCDPGVCPDPEGACCFDTGECLVLTQDDCQTQGGLYQGDDTVCAPELCPPPKGACCFSDGSCAARTAEECAAQGGDYLGDETVCVPNLCPDPEGACCFDDGSCNVLTRDDCESQGGVYQGDDTICEPDLCPPTKGACCFTDGSCAARTPDECAAEGGVYQGDDTICDPDLCPEPKGACCFDDGGCSVIEQDLCGILGGDYQGDDTSCDPNECPQPKGACCFDDGDCAVLTEDECIAAGGEYHGDDTTCDPNECPQPEGACCFDNGDCLVFTQEECADQGGDYRGDDTSCDPNECPQPTGACCLRDGTCIDDLTGNECRDEGGDFQGVGSDCLDVVCRICALNLEIGTGGPCDSGNSTSRAFWFESDLHGGSNSHRYAWQEVGTFDEYADGTAVLAGRIAHTEVPERIFDVVVELSDLVAPGDAGYPPAGSPKLPSQCDPDTSMWRYYETFEGTMIGDGSMSGAVITFVRQGESLQIGFAANLQNDNFGASSWLEYTIESQPDDGPHLGGSNGDINTDLGECPPGACCLSDLECIETDADTCDELGGEFLGDGTTCDSNPCAPDGACCFPDEDCNTGTFECTQKISFMTMIWDGDEPVRIRAYDGNTGDDLLADIDNIQIGDAVTVGPLNGPNDSIWEIFEAGTDNLIGESKFHRSCSDNEMNGPEDCGNRQGNGKSNDDRFLNDWILEGLVDGSGASFDCGLSGGGNGNCEVLPEADCVSQGGTFQGTGTSCDDVECADPMGACCLSNHNDGCMNLSEFCCQMLGGLYLGDGTSCSSSECFDCDGKIVEMTMIWDGDEPVRIRAYDGDTDDELLADIDNIQIGDAVTVGPLNGPNDSIWEIFRAGTDHLIGESKFHRSCSDNEMNGAEDCGRRQGNGKGNDDGFINDWILEGLVDDSGGVLDCNGSPGPLEIEREITEDVNGDLRVDTADVLALFRAWGECESCPEDVNGDGMVDFADLLEVLANQS